jgi:molybdenum cofactor cytidylyltransferase
VNRVGCAILAAGASRRLGRPKQLLLFKGNELVRHLAIEALRSRVDEVAVVLGAHRERVGAAVNDLPLACLVNLDWREGIASSIRTATHWATSQRVDALILMLSDQPYLEASHLDRLATEYAAGATVVASRYGGVSGVPALFASTAFPSLFALNGDAGAGAFLQRSPFTRCVEWPAGTIDIDTTRDLASMLERSAPPPMGLTSV